MGNTKILSIGLGQFFLTTIPSQIVWFFKLDFVVANQSFGKKLSIILDVKFHEFSFSKIRFLIGIHLLKIWAFAVSFPNGGSIFLIYNHKGMKFPCSCWCKNGNSREEFTLYIVTTHALHIRGLGRLFHKSPSHYFQ